MPFITFFYRYTICPDPSGCIISGNHYGKYVSDYMSDDHEGLDKEVRYVLKEALKKYHKTRGECLKNIVIGVLSFSESASIPVFSSGDEIDAFDFYYRYDAKSGGTSYIRGEPLSN